MFAQTYLLPTVAVLGVVAAQTSANSAICTQVTATINSQADATALADCSTFSGSIAVGSGVSGMLAIDGIQQITGDLVVNNATGLTSLSSDQIGTIGGTFALSGLTLLSTLQFNSLTSAGSINWQNLPALPGLTFPSTLSKSTNVTILNTFLSTLDGINLNTVKVIDIENNNRLTTFSTQVANITGSAIIGTNGKELAVSFPNLIWAASLNLIDVASISIPSLAAVNQSLIIREGLMTSISAPNLTSVGSTQSNQGSLSLVGDSQLANISFPALKTIGGACQVANNTKLGAIAFPALQYVGGAIDFEGNFTTPQIPAIQNVKGAFNVQSTQTIDCSSFSSVEANIQGKPTCSSAATKVGSGGTSSGSSSPSGTKGAAASYGISEAAAGLSVVGGLLQMLL